MRKISWFLLLTVIIFQSCNQPTFKKGKDNLEYKIIPDGSGPTIQYGNYMQIEFATYYNNGKKDSLLNESRSKGAPVIEMLDTLSTPPAYYDILKQLRKGDSVAIRILTDSAFKKAPEQMPPFFKKGHFLITTIKVVNVFINRNQADSARKAVIAIRQKADSINAIAQLAKDDKTLKEYFAKNKLNPVKTEKGVYVDIITPGTGTNIDTSVIVKINYTGRTLSGVMFDSNTDPAKGHVEPLNANLTSDPSLGQSVITGWKEGLKLLNKGAKAKFYIPSPLGYGAEGAGADIAPNTILTFDIDVLDVLSKEQVKADMEAQNKQFQEMQKRYMDSIAKVKKIDSTKK